MSPFRERLRRWWRARLPLEDRCELSQRRIYLLPTRFGLLLMAVALAVWLGALNYQVSLAYALAFWIAGLLLVAVLMAYRQLAGLRLSADGGPAVFAGETAVFSLLLENRMPAVRRLRVAVDGGEPRACELEAMSDGRVALAVVAARRGWTPLPACVVDSDAPFGLVRAWAVLKLRARVLAYPAPLPDAARGRHDAETGRGGGERAGDEDFSHLDAYRYGDAPQQIAWKVMARRDLLASKRFSAEAGAPLLRLGWDDYIGESDPERRLSRLAWRVEQCERRRLRYRLCLPDGEIGPQPGQRERALGALALFGTAP
ncbi:hypothetical protein CR207_17115 [Chromobacterium violaceum]|uniref:DUF58 domain-containing protein n=1 Tax=Chromobacterium violaceum TaxID=536 RepID=UPI000C125CCA|nr:DUF58 domain-containing protein [Chromobacterium violaceum]ATP29959.1 hypothetical protein CRN81_17095 [Chromobacterium violaceum]ATP33865.1 hypothetical protein CR207_17115 [Chromobacterium violaceum]